MKLSERLKEADKSSKILNEKKSAKITKRHYYMTDELYEDFYYCPDCDYFYIIFGNNFCPNCGIKIEFSKTIKKENE
jgi:hypothetical protein